MTLQQVQDTTLRQAQDTACRKLPPRPSLTPWPTNYTSDLSAATGPPKPISIWAILTTRSSCGPVLSTPSNSLPLDGGATGPSPGASHCSLLSACRTKL